MQQQEQLQARDTHSISVLKRREREEHSWKLDSFAEVTRTRERCVVPFSERGAEGLCKREKRRIDEEISQLNVIKKTSEGGNLVEANYPYVPLLHTGRQRAWVTLSAPGLITVNDDLCVPASTPPFNWSYLISSFVDTVTFPDDDDSANKERGPRGK